MPGRAEVIFYPNVQWDGCKKSTIPPQSMFFCIKRKIVSLCPSVKRDDWLRRKLIWIIYGMVGFVFKGFFWTKIKLKKDDSKIRHHFFSYQKNIHQPITVCASSQSCLITWWFLPREEVYLKSPILAWDRIQYVQDTQHLWYLHRPL